MFLQLMVEGGFFQFGGEVGEAVEGDGELYRTGLVAEGLSQMSFAGAGRCGRGPGAAASAGGVQPGDRRGSGSLRRQSLAHRPDGLLLQRGKCALLPGRPG